MSGSFWESLSFVREWSGGHSGCPEVLGRPSRMSGSGRETIPDFRKLSGVSLEVFKFLPDVWGWRQALLDVRQFMGDRPGCLGGPPGCPGVVGRPARKFGSLYRMSESARETLSDVRE